jgi:hypothetical protein
MTTDSAGKLIITFRVGHRYRCTMFLDLAGIGTEDPPLFNCWCQWSPKPPRKLSDREAADYRRGRSALISELAKLNNWRIILAEPDNGRVEMIGPSTEGPGCPN